MLHFINQYDPIFLNIVDTASSASPEELSVLFND